MSEREKGETPAEGGRVQAGNGNEIQQKSCKVGASSGVYPPQIDIPETEEKRKGRWRLMPLWDSVEEARIRQISREREKTERDILSTGECRTCKLFRHSKVKMLGEGESIPLGPSGGSTGICYRPSGICPTVMKVIIERKGGG